MDEELETQINKTKVKESFDLFEAGVRGKINDEVVLAIGSTRSGKSTILNILAGQDIEIKKHGLTHVIDTIGKNYPGEIKDSGFEAITIAHGSDSYTNFPNFINVRGMQIWDVSGFSDNRGVEQEICNAFYLQKILRTATRGVKCIVVQDSLGALQEGGESFRSCITTVCKIFEPKSHEDFERLINATTFVFNRVPQEVMFEEDYTPDSYIETVLSKLPNQAQANALQKKSSAVQAYTKFIETMEHMGSRIRHIEVPEAETETVSSVEEIRRACSGILDNVESSRSFRGVTSITLSEKGYWIVRALICHSQLEMQQLCNKLVPIFREMWKNFERARNRDCAKIEIKDMLNVLELRDKAIIDGGASRVSIDLVQRLETYNMYSDESFKEALMNLKEIVQLIQFLSDVDVTQNKSCGAHFTYIADAILKGAETYLNDITIQELREKTEAAQAHIEKLDRDWRRGVLQCAAGTFLIVGGGTLKVIGTVRSLAPLDHAGTAMILKGVDILSKVSFRPAGADAGESL